MLMLVTAACWDGWRWLFHRIEMAPEEGLALVLVVVLFVVTHLRQPAPWGAHKPPLVFLTAVLAVYAASQSFAPPIVRSTLAVMAALACLHSLLFANQPPVTFWALVALAMPVLPSLQFMLGYPMRVACAALTVMFLRAQGHAVTREASNLIWRGDTIQFDAPCSGVSMLRAGLLLTLMGCAMMRLSIWKTLAAMAICTVLAIVCNALRASSLFYFEAGLLAQPASWWHEGTGIAAFALLAGATLWMLAKLNPPRASA
ncbi:MAG: archaeosortase/exosortase family protein [Burkholderiales bacterium]